MGGAGGEHLANPPPPAIPIEIVTEEEMALIELALSAAAAASAARLRQPPKLLSLLPSSARGGPALSGFRSRRSLSVCSSAGPSSDDIEDSGGAGPKQGGRPLSLLERFRKRRGLAVTDITASYSSRLGTVKLLPQVPDDIWHLYNLIAVGDVFESRTTRKVQSNKHGDFASTHRVTLSVELTVDKVEYDKGGLSVRILGTNRSKNIYVDFEQQHTTEVRLLRPVVLTKRIWDSVALGILKRACRATKHAELAVVLMQEGLAHIFLVGNNVTLDCSRTKCPIPLKHVDDGKKASLYEEAMNNFFHTVYNDFLRKVDMRVVQCVVIASPGFTNSQFCEYLFKEAEKEGVKQVMKSKSSVILAHTTSGFKHSLKEVLQAPHVVKLIKDRKAAKEVQALQDFYDVLMKSPTRACYGPRHVEYAHEQKAIHTLLITDQLFRNADAKIREYYVDLVDSIKASKGVVRIFSTMHTSGEHLANISGIAAILRCPLDELDDIEM